MASNRSQVTSADLQAQAVGVAQIAQSIAAPIIVTKSNINDGTVVSDRTGGLAYNAYDGKMYRNAGGAGSATSWNELIYSSTQISGQLSDAQLTGLSAAKLTGQIVNTQISDNSISTPKLQAGSVTTAALAAASVVAGVLAAGSVTTPALAAGSVTSLSLAAGSVVAGKVAAGAISAAQIAARQVQAQHLALVAPSLCGDPNFTSPAWWTSPSVTASGATLAGPNGANAGWSFESNPGATNTPGYIILRASGSATLYGPLLPVNPGSVYELSCICSNSTNQNAFYELRWINSSGNQVGSSGVITIGPGDSGGQVRRAQGTVPANAVYATQVLYCNNVTSGQVYFAQSDLREAGTGTLVVDGSITAQKLVVDSVLANQVVTNVTTTNVLNANVLNSASSLPASLAIGTTGFSLGSVQTYAADPAARLNALTTLVSPGKIQLQGATTLSSWQSGGDTTKIEGGAIAANTIAANKVTIGVRGITVYSGSFTCQPGSPNTLHWTGGIIQYVANDGSYQQVSIGAQDMAYNGNPIWVWWNGGGSFGTTTDATIVGDPTVVIMATFYGNNFFIANYGGTIIDGSRITTGSVQAAQIAAGTITGDRIAGGTITGNNIAAGSITAGSIGAGTISVGVALGGQGKIQLDGGNGRIIISD